MSFDSSSAAAVSGPVASVPGPVASVPSPVASPSLPGFYYFSPSVVCPILLPRLQEIFNYLSSPDFEISSKSVGSSANSRKVIQYGHSYSYKGGSVSNSINPFPDFITSLITSIISNFISQIFSNIPLDYFDSVIINRYLPGQGISAHTDSSNFSELIVCVSLGGPAIIRFSQNATSDIDILAESCSIYVMSGQARYNFTHSMQARKTDTIDGKVIKRETRFSLTFRKAV